MEIKAIIGAKIRKRVKTILVQFDGHLDHTGLILCRYYNSQEKIIELMKSGNLCQLSEPDNCASYHQDTTKKSQKAKYYHDKDELKFLADYAYYFDGKNWFIHGIGDGNDKYLDWVEIQIIRRLKTI